ncbi:hypothetical protein B0919_16985 [Hymenobacter sp. CRA2]|nr:hypothetical protein B0919_16985 [Hymenobacter sp. CRA2]
MGRSGLGGRFGLDFGLAGCRQALVRLLAAAGRHDELVETRRVFSRIIISIRHPHASWLAKLVVTGN